MQMEERPAHAGSLQCKSFLFWVCLPLFAAVRTPCSAWALLSIYRRSKINIIQSYKQSGNFSRQSGTSLPQLACPALSVTMEKGDHRRRVTTGLSGPHCSEVKELASLELGARRLPLFRHHKC